jgi:hypothetical protein
VTFCAPSLENIDPVMGQGHCFQKVSLPYMCD